MSAEPWLVEVLRDVLDWNEDDLRNLEEITPNETMLRNRSEVLKEAISKAEQTNRPRGINMVTFANSLLKAEAARQRALTADLVYRISEKV